MDKFYFTDQNGLGHYDIPLNATNWDEAIAEVKQTTSYARLTYSKTHKKKLHIVYDYVEVHKNARRVELTFDDLRNPEVYRKVY